MDVFKEKPVVRRIKGDVVIETAEYSHSLRVPAPKPVQLSQKEQMLRAFERFARNRRRLSFDQCVEEWIKSRAELHFRVDDDDPDADEPSTDFREFLRTRFAQIRSKKKR